MLEDSWVWSKPAEGSSLEDTGPPLPLCPSEHAWHCQDRELGASVRHRAKPDISSLLTTESLCFHHYHNPQTLESLSSSGAVPSPAVSGRLEGLCPSPPISTLHP